MDSSAALGPLSPILREILDAAGRKRLSQAQLARSAHLTPEALSRLKKSGRGDFETVARLASAVGMEVVVRPKSSYATRLAEGILRSP